MLEAAVAAATLLQRAGAKAAERIPQLPEEERQKRMGYKGRAALSLAGSKPALAMPPRLAALRASLTWQASLLQQWAPPRCLRPAASLATTAQLG